MQHEQTGLDSDAETKRDSGNLVCLRKTVHCLSCSRIMSVDHEQIVRVLPRTSIALMRYLVKVSLCCKPGLVWC